MNKTAKRMAWESRVAEFKASGQSGAAWCATHQLRENQLWYWLHKFRDEEKAKSAPTWVAVELNEPKTTDKNDSLTVKVGQHAAIEIKPNFNRELLQEVLQTLVVIC